jgi:hypothetical protein
MDVKELKLGWQGSPAYDTCHRGISPFGMNSTSAESHQRLRAMEEDSALATTTTLADVRASRTKPPPCPTDYFGLLQMVCAYLKLLTMLFGSYCEHLRNVMTNYDIFRDRMVMYERLQPKQVANILWIIFLDARAYFSTPHDEMGNPPVSSLDWMIGGLRSGIPPPGVVGAPIDELLGTTPRLPRGGITSTPRQDDEQGGPRYQRSAVPPNPDVHSRLEAEAADAIRCSPSVSFKSVAAVATPRPNISHLKLFPGGCFDYLFFGNCRNPHCSFKHDGQVTEGKIDQVVAKMRPALAQFVAANNGRA